MATEDGYCTDELIHLYEELAKGGVGLIIAGHASVQANGRSSFRMTGLHTDDFIPGLKRLTESVHRHDAKIVLQINHGGRQTPAQFIAQTPVAPSSLEASDAGAETRGLTAREVEELIEAYGQAARRAREAGYDGVQIHGAHGYMVTQFLSPLTNKRDDRWGGSIENRMRFVVEVYQKCRKAVGDHYPVMIKLSCAEFLEGGYTLEEGCKVAKSLTDAGIDAIEVSGGVVGGGKGTINADNVPIRRNIKIPDEEAYFMKESEVIREHADAPLMLVGGMRTPALMERLLAEKRGEFISLCRPFIMEPHLVNMIRTGQTDPVGCVSCNLCLTKRTESVRCHYLENEQQRNKRD
jgi:2,4-dienoyl-CoA reductase-like NADH-dependent reductase (Old Yellow Enzyme family)